MSDRRVDPLERDLEALLRDMNEVDIELLEPPDEVWDNIEAQIGSQQDGLANVIPLDSKKRPVRRVLVRVAAALIVAVIGVGAFLAFNSDNGEVVASATLAYDPVSFDPLGSNASGGANLVSDDGRLTIDIVDADLPTPGEGAELEVWLIRPDDDGNVADLVSLGLVDPNDPGSLEVPPSHDPATYYVVDISIEPRDGDASHSGRSILRGLLTTV
ncbi:MAG: anti-sigma factor [Acidimicrobiia bacterium]|nr:anti-sigma factor [Acidimicrobiia bacterium]